MTVILIFLAMPFFLNGIIKYIFDHAIIPFNTKTSILFIIIFTLVVVFDSTIIKFSTSSGFDITKFQRVVGFIILYVIFVSSSLVFSSFIKTGRAKSIPNLALSPRLFRNTILSAQITITILIFIIILQMMIVNKFSLLLLQVLTYLTHISALVFLIPLVYMFLVWLRSKRSYAIMMYTISFFLISLTILLSLIYLEYYYSLSNIKEVKPYAVHLVVISFTATYQGELMATIFKVLSLASFLTIWIVL